jgi:hypothetical protein
MPYPCAPHSTCASGMCSFLPGDYRDHPFMDLIVRSWPSRSYKTRPRVSVIVDNGSDHCGQEVVKRARHAWPNAVMIHTSVHAS